MAKKPKNVFKVERTRAYCPPDPGRAERVKLWFDPNYREQVRLRGRLEDQEDRCPPS